MYPLRRPVRALRFELADQRQHALAEVLDLFLEVQEAAEDQIDAGGLVVTMRDAMYSAFQSNRAEPIVVLNEVFKRRVCPVALPSARPCRLASRRRRRVHRFGIRVLDDVVQTCFASCSVSRAITMR